MIAIDPDTRDSFVTLAVAFLVFIPAFIVAINQTRRVGRKVDEASSAASEASDAAAEAVQVAKENTDTGNGRSLARYVVDMARLQQIMSAQLHTNTTELLSLNEKVHESIVEGKKVHQEILKRLDNLEGDPDVRLQ